jgi:hypothetical protein
MRLVRHACAVFAALTLAFLPESAQAQGGLLGRARRRAEEALAGTARRSPFPAGFASPEYALTEARLDAILRGADSAQAASRRNQAIYAQPEAPPAAPSAAQRETTAHARCTLEVGAALTAMRLGRGGAESDPTRQRLLALQQRAQRTQQEAAARQQAGQPLDTLGVLRATVATTDTIARLLGRSCPAPSAAALRLMAADEDDEDDATPAADQGSRVPAGVVSPDEVFRRVAGVEDRQWGVMRDKFVAFFEATSRNVALDGFAAEETRALQQALPRLRRYEPQLKGEKGW